MARQSDLDNVTQVIQQVDDHGNPRLVEIGNGAARCWCGKIPWCEHIEKIIKDGDDLLDGLLADSEAGSFSVPFIPTHGIWVPVKFSRVEIDSYAWMLWVSDSLIDRVDGFLGVVGPGEGRAVVRGMIHTWSLRYLDGSLKCSFAGHNYKSEMALRARIHEKAFAAANQWTLRWEGRCLPCHTAGHADSDFDDLVPDVMPASSRRWSGNKIEMEKW